MAASALALEPKVVEIGRVSLDLLSDRIMSISSLLDTVSWQVVEKYLSHSCVRVVVLELQRLGSAGVSVPVPVPAPGGCILPTHSAVQDS